MMAEHGSAKTTSAKRIVQLIDPSPAELRSPPRDAEQWITAASGSWVVALDNLSSIPQWLSDFICRASTFDGNVKRALYTDDNLSVAKFRRSVIITGIDVGGLSGDLTDRLVPIELRAIETRLPESELEKMWEADRAEILGALLNLAAKVHHKLPTLEHMSLPRMADFGRVLMSVDAIYGSKGVDRYYESGKRMMADSARSNPFIARLMDMRYSTEGAGQAASEILARVSQSGDSWGNTPAEWPKKARDITTLLHKHAPALRTLDWKISNDYGRNKECVTKWTIEPPADKRTRKGERVEF